MRKAKRAKPAPPVAEKNTNRCHKCIHYLICEKHKQEVMRNLESGNAHAITYADRIAARYCEQYTEGSFEL